MNDVQRAVHVKMYSRGDPEDGLNAVQMSLPLMPSNTEDLFVDQMKFLFPTHSREWWDIYHLFKSKDELHKMDSNYCERVQFQEYEPDVRKKKLLDRVKTAKGFWEEYFKKNARIIKTKHGTHTFCNFDFEKMWKDTEKEVAEKMGYVEETSEELREEITCNPHLHACIKENLLYNLDRILEKRDEEHKNNCPAQ